MLPSPQASPRLVTPTIAIVLLLLSTVPFWIERVGLYPYLGIEIIIWSIYALGFNLVLGYSGLPSFGHGADLASAHMHSVLRSSIFFQISGSACSRQYSPQRLPARSSRFSFRTGAESILR